MDKKLSVEEVLHVASLARLDLTKEEIEKFRVQLKELLDEIDKIKDISVITDEIMISPNENICTLTSDTAKDMLDIKDVLRNAPHSFNDYIEIRGDLND